MNNFFHKAVDYRTYQLKDKLSEYDHTFFTNINKMSSRIASQMKPHSFEHFDPISIIGFLCHFNLACENIEIKDGAKL